MANSVGPDKTAPRLDIKFVKSVSLDLNKGGNASKSRR